MRKFDLTKLSTNDLKEMNEAVCKVAPKVRFWYSLLNAFTFTINQDSIVEQTRAVSDYEKLKDGREWLSQDDYNTRSIHISTVPTRGFSLAKLIGMRNLDICVYNPANPITRVQIGRRTGELVQIDALGWGNTNDGRINFERGYAVIREEEQDLAHRLGLMFTPAGILEVDACTSSDTEMHKDKQRVNEKGQPILYCDNRACQKQIRNPILIIDSITGGAYHSDICYGKDIRVKSYLGLEGCSPKEIYLDEAISLFQGGELQQSLNSTRDSPKLRSLEAWPEAALLFIP